MAPSTFRAYGVEVQIQGASVPRVRVTRGREKSTIPGHMDDLVKSCPHFEGLRIAAGSTYLCPVCGESLDAAGLARWVREAERARDRVHSMVEGDGFEEIAREEAQREVYRRRRVMYEVENVPRIATARPEMVLIVHDAARSSYECRVFYKEPRPVGGVEQVSVRASRDTILGLHSNPDPVVRLISGKVEEFHALRMGLVEDGAPAPERRVFYSNEL